MIKNYGELTFAPGNKHFNKTELEQKTDNVK